MTVSLQGVMTLHSTLKVNSVRAVSGPAVDESAKLRQKREDGREGGGRTLTVTFWLIYHHVSLLVRVVNCGLLLTTAEQIYTRGAANGHFRNRRVRLRRFDPRGAIKVSSETSHRRVHLFHAVWWFEKG